MDKDFPELRNCDCCKHDKIEEVELEFLNENITGDEACRILNVGKGKFKKHIENHLKKDISSVLSANAPALAKRVFDKTNELIESCDRTLNMLKEVQTEWVGQKKPEWVTAAVKLETVISNNIEKLSKLNGEVQHNGTLKIEQMNIQVNNMTQELIEGMCPACKAKLAPKLLNSVGLNNINASP